MQTVYPHTNTPAVEQDKLIEMGFALSEALDYSSHRAAVSVADTIMRSSLSDLTVKDAPSVTVQDGEYKRSLIYTDPKKRFTILVLHWGGGAETPVHGHKAWGCIGVLDGHMGCACYTRVSSEKDRDELGMDRLGLTMDIQIEAGDIASVNPDPEGIHKLYTHKGQTAKTIHIYGMDLEDDPARINVCYENQDCAVLS